MSDVERVGKLMEIPPDYSMASIQLLSVPTVQVIL